MVQRSFFKLLVPRWARGQYRRRMRKGQGGYNESSGAYHDLQETSDTQHGVGTPDAPFQIADTQLPLIFALLTSLDVSLLDPNKL